MKKGDIILIPFPFTDLTGNKMRPALILFVKNEDVCVSFITTQIHRMEMDDLLINPSTLNGLKFQSIIKLTKI